MDQKMTPEERGRKAARELLEMQKANRKKLEEEAMTMPIPADENTVDFLTRAAEAGDQKALVLLRKIQADSEWLSLYRQQAGSVLQGDISDKELRDLGLDYLIEDEEKSNQME